MDSLYLFTAIKRVSIVESFFEWSGSGCPVRQQYQQQQQFYN